MVRRFDLHPGLSQAAAGAAPRAPWAGSFPALSLDAWGALCTWPALGVESEEGLDFLCRDRPRAGLRCPPAPCPRSAPAGGGAAGGLRAVRAASGARRRAPGPAAGQ